VASTDLNLDLPLLSETDRSWAEIASARLDLFLADHAGCEQQAALSALSPADRYLDDAELVDKLTSLAMEEIVHFRRVGMILRSRSIYAGRKRSNPWVRALLKNIQDRREPHHKVDRLLVGALIEARSCERFTRLMEVTDDVEVKELLTDLGPAEARHWRMFHDLATRELPREDFRTRWQAWLEFESELTAKGGKLPTVHG
jgi:tRNA-(ms[2]io[6]A)-hydroxylase